MINTWLYTVQGPGRARVDPFLLALGPGPQGRANLCWPWPSGSGQSLLALAPGRLGPGPVGLGQGWVRADPDPSNVFKIKYINIIKLYNYLYTKKYTYKLI